MVTRHASRAAALLVLGLGLALPGAAFADRQRPPAPPAKAACIAADAAFNQARFDGGAVTACTTDDVCWRVDLATSAWTAAPPLPAIASRRPGQLDVDATGIKLCAPGAQTCDAVVLPDVDTKSSDTQITALTNADQSLIAVMSGGGPVRVFDAKTRKQLYAAKPNRAGHDDIPIVQGFQFVGDALYVLSSASPVSSSGRLYRARTGAFLLDIGKRGAMVDELAPVQLDGDRYVFGTWMMESLVIADVKKGKVVKKIALGGDPMKPGGSLVLLAVTPDHKIVALGSDPSTFTLQVVDPDSGKRTAIKIPRC